MPFELRVTPGDSLARVRGWGSEDFASTTEAMQRLGQDPRILPGVPVLMDVRELDDLGVARPFAEKSERAGAQTEVFAEPDLAVSSLKAGQ